MPAISLSEYIERLSCYGSLSYETLICALIYIDRYILAKKISLTPHEMHRIVLVASVLSMKFHFDHYFDNKCYAKVGGITLEELNDLERDFLDSIDYKLNIREREYKRYKDAIRSYGKVRTSTRRGTY